MNETRITPKQMRRMQTLWGLLCAQIGADAKERETRLCWVGAKIGRTIQSFNELTLNEAKLAIREMHKLLPAEQVKRANRATAKAYGTAGRKGFSSTEIRLADAQTWALLDRLLAQLGWNRERLDAFIRSAKSPTQGKMIHTLDQANKVIWTLKGMLRRASGKPRVARGEHGEKITGESATT